MAARQAARLQAQARHDVVVAKLLAL